MAASGDAGRHAHELHFGAGHARGGDHLEHAPRGSTLRNWGGHETNRKRWWRLTGEAVGAVQVGVKRWVVVHFHMAINFELFAAGPNVFQQFGQRSREV